MPKNITGGNKTKKKKNHLPKNYTLILKENDDYGYAQVISNLGNGLLNLNLLTNNNKLNSMIIGHIRGKIRRVKFNKDDVVLIGFRNFEKDYKDIRNVDVLHKYSDEHIKQLIDRNEIKLISNLYGLKNDDDDDYIIFSKDNDFNRSNNDSESDSESNSESKSSIKSNTSYYSNKENFLIDDDGDVINIDEI